MIGQKGVVLEGRAGGIEKHVAEVTRRLVSFGHNVTLYVRRRYHQSSDSHFAGAKLFYVPTIYTKNLEAIIYTFIATIHAIFQKYDIIHYHGVGPATLAWIPRILSPKTTVIVTFHSQDRFHQKWGWFARKYLALGERAAVTFPHYCIAVSHVIQVYCRDTFGVEVVYIPNGAVGRVVKEKDVLEKFGLRENEYLINVSRLVPHKGQHLLIEAFKMIDTDKDLVFVGAPSFTDKYYRQLRELAKDDARIRFLGFQTGQVLDQLYAHAYLYVHPSIAEGLPLVVLEAMSFGTAPLVSDIPAMLEAAHHAGFSFHTGSVLDLQHNLEETLGNSDLVKERGEEARAIIEVHFNWDRITEHTESVYITARH